MPYQPGKKSRNPVGNYRYSHNRLAWLDTAITKMAIMRYSQEEMAQATKEVTLPLDQGEYGDTIRLLITTYVGRPFTLNITAMTHEEFVAFREMLTLLFRLVEPIIIERDRRAEDAAANGDDSLARNYRAAPQFIVREGSLPPDSESLLDGLTSVLTGPKLYRDPSGEIRRRSISMADAISQVQSTQDDRAATDEPESIREMGEVGGSVDGLQSTDPGEGDTSSPT